MAGRKKAAPVAEDTLIDDSEQEPKAKRSRAAGPKKVKDTTVKVAGELLADGIRMATDLKDDRKNITKEEAVSIGEPTVRIFERRVKKWLEPLMPMGNLKEDDMQDLKEIAASLAKWTLRVIMVSMKDLMDTREAKRKGEQPAPAAQGSTPAAHQGSAYDEPFIVDADETDIPVHIVERAPAASTMAGQNGHNPLLAQFSLAMPEGL